LFSLNTPFQRSVETVGIFKEFTNSNKSSSALENLIPCHINKIGFSDLLSNFKNFSIFSSFISIFGSRL